MKNMFLLLILCLGVHISLVGQINLKGSNLSYAGKELSVKTYSDPFTYKEVELARATVQSNGDFHLPIDIKETRLIFIPLGIYKGFLFVEPGKTYNIKLPPRRDKKPAEKLNPYFKQEELLLGIADASDSELNLIIRRLDDQLDSYINKNINRIYNKGAQSPGLHYMADIKAQFATQENPFFNKYLEYRVAILEYLSYPRSFGKIESKYFKSKDIQYRNPAYISLFKKLYGNFLTGYLNRKQSNSLSKALTSSDIYNSFTSILQKYDSYTDEDFRNLVLLKGAYDACTSKIYPRKKMVSLIREIKSYTKDYHQQNIAENMIFKLTNLQKGFPAPNFHFTYKDNDYNLEQYRGKFLYLTFLHTQNYACQQDMNQLINLHNQFGDQISFLSIATDWDNEKMNSFLESKEIKWPVICVGENQQIIKDYRIKAFPTYILIDPNGNIIKAPAPGPKEHIDYEFLKIRRHLQRMEYQQKRKKFN